MWDKLFPFPYQDRDGDIASTDKIKLHKIEESNLHIPRDAQKWFCETGKDRNKLAYDFIQCWRNVSFVHGGLSGARHRSKGTGHESNFKIALEEL